MSGTYGFCQTPLKSTVPDGKRGVGPIGGLKSRCPAAGWLNAPVPTNTASSDAARWFFTEGSFYCGCFGGAGLSPPEDPANTLRPSGSFTRRALHVFEPSFASTPSITIWSPIFNESLVQPFRVSVLGGPPSHCHGCTPLSPL